MAVNLKTYIVSIFSYILNKIEYFLVSLLKSVKSKVVKYSRKQYKGPEFQRFHGFLFFVHNIILFPWNVFYLIYLSPIVFLANKLWNIFRKIFRRKKWFQESLLLMKNIHLLHETITAKILGMEIVELFIFCVGATFEVIVFPLVFL
jgi:hypothetical protein